MVIDGKAIATDILASVTQSVAQLAEAPRLSAITCAPNFETQKYLEMKRQKAAAVGIHLNVVQLPADSTTIDVVQCVQQVAKESAGIVVQLPLPAQVNREAVLAAIPADKDPDGFSYGTAAFACVPPVVGAIIEIAARHGLVWEGKSVIILGEGRLVGAPAAHFARNQGADVTVLTKNTFAPELLKTADVIVSGIGQPHFITPKMVKPGVAIFDAGTSEDGGVLAGDVHPDVHMVAGLITPVPGGIGPITIAILLRNLLELVSR